jgi:hypothetical protein
VVNFRSIFMPRLRPCVAGIFPLPVVIF